MTFWYMQVHPGSQPRKFNSKVMRESISRTYDVGIGDEHQWREDGLATQARFREDVKEGDVAIIAHGKELMFLVCFGKFGRNHDKSDSGHWYGLKRDVEILSYDPIPYAQMFAKQFGKAASDGLPIRQTLARIKTNEFAKFWYEQVKKNGAAAESQADDSMLVRRNIASRDTWQRSSAVVARVRAKGVCEACGKKETFLKEDGSQYFEGHHLIPMCLQASFKVSLDVPGNVVCLCPQCHRFLHFGREQYRKRCLADIYNRRASILAKAGIANSKIQFFRFALGIARE